MEPEKVKISEPWKLALRKEFLSLYFDHLTQFLKNTLAEGKTIYPPGPLIFQCYNTIPPDQIKVIIIGQDPYHNPGEAMGLSFSVPRGQKVPPSLKNIYKELQSDVGVKLPDHGDLTTWAEQGVFMLNAVLTVEKNKPGSHKNIGWQTFTDQTIKYLSDSYTGLVFMLWGNFAKNKKTLIDQTKHLILESAHPSPLAGNAFQGCRHFSKANEYLQNNGKEVINWQL